MERSNDNQGQPQVVTEESRVLLLLIIQLSEKANELSRLLLTGADWSLQIIHIVMQWRDMLFQINQQIQPLINIAVFQQASSLLNGFIWCLDFSILPQWAKELFALSTSARRLAWGRPRRFQEYVPVIRYMIEELEYTSIQVRDIVGLIGVTITARQLRRILQYEGISHTNVNNDDNFVAALIYHGRFVSGALTYNEGILAIQGYLLSEFGSFINLIISPIV